MLRSFPLLQEIFELRFRFCLPNLPTKCLSKVNLRRATGYISPFRLSIQDSNKLWSFLWPPDIVNFRLKSLLVITLVQSKQI